MLSFFGLRKDQSKKPSAERELDGFVIIGETVEEQRQGMNTLNVISTHVLLFSPAPQRPSGAEWPPSPAHGSGGDAAAVPSLPELLADVPFALAPHILAVQTGRPALLLPDLVLNGDINHNLDNFRYDFTLENSVLNEP
ncbi:UBAP1-MVB12-associated (UMA)-domain containing protein 1 [Alosa alosa]|uniref:UBAP1-MVB12-associated (UMA)-domain containing protein 1 n=1 Tax=Alosa alosa TaxID=278164 RepID=UPI0020151A01|nr:UBAP1-MVB12-associated (UMA)-domain containing protein 1 [Alosa alosa]